MYKHYKTNQYIDDQEQEALTCSLLKSVYNIELTIGY